MIVTTGKNEIRDFLIGTTATAFTRIEIGDDDTAAAVTDTALIGTPYGEDGATETEPSITSVMFSIDVAVGEGNGGGTVLYKEVGILTGAAGTMLCRQVYSDETKDNTIAFTVQVVVGVKS